MKSPESEIDAALETLKLRGVHKLEPAEAAGVVKRARAVFVEGNPRVWWLGLVGHVTRTAYAGPDWKDLMDRTLRAVKASTCYLIPESDTPVHVVYECRPLDIAKILGKCMFFEYYVVDQAMKWLVADTDHNEILVVKAGRRA